MLSASSKEVRITGPVPFRRRPSCPLLRRRTGPGTSWRSSNHLWPDIRVHRGLSGGLSGLQTWWSPPFLASTLLGSLLCCHLLTLGHTLSSLHPCRLGYCCWARDGGPLAGHLLKPARLPCGLCPAPDPWGGGGGGPRQHEDRPGWEPRARKGSGSVPTSRVQPWPSHVML